MSDNSRPNNRVLLLSEMLRGHHKFFVNSSIFFPSKFCKVNFLFYCNKLKEIIQFNSGVRCTIKCWRIEQRKHQNNSNSRSKVFVQGGHPKCIINTALSLATTSLPLKAGHGFAALQKSTTFTTAIFQGKFIIYYFFQLRCFTQDLYTFADLTERANNTNVLLKVAYESPLASAAALLFPQSP